MVLIHFTKKSIDYPFLRSRGLPSWTGNGQLTSSRSSTPPAQFGRATDAARPAHHGLGSSPIGVPIGDAVRRIRRCTPCVCVCVCVCVILDVLVERHSKASQQHRRARRVDCGLIRSRDVSVRSQRPYTTELYILYWSEQNGRKLSPPPTTPALTTLLG